MHIARGSGPALLTTASSWRDLLWSALEIRPIRQREGNDFSLKYSKQSPKSYYASGMWGEVAAAHVLPMQNKGNEGQECDCNMGVIQLTHSGSIFKGFMASRKRPQTPQIT